MYQQWWSYHYSGGGGTNSPQVVPVVCQKHSDSIRMPVILLPFLVGKMKSILKFSECFWCVTGHCARLWGLKVRWQQSSSWPHVGQEHNSVPINRKISDCSSREHLLLHGLSGRQGRESSRPLLVHALPTSTLKYNHI